jgi:DNA mismatch repair protein MutL
MGIHILPPEVASQIAAGEVVERPASVVKELVENALDAGARTISISVHNAGRTLLEVADDGAGIPAAELALAVERHATSKLQAAGDLFHVATLGFRGEALASIGSVSRLTLTSRTAEAAAGERLHVDAGILTDVGPVGAPVGTVVRVEELFYNVPARLKFLKQDATERRQIDALVTRYALAYPDVRFSLSDGSTVAFQTAGDGDRRAVLAGLYGVDVARQLLEVEAQEEGTSLSGFVSPVSLTRSNRKDITFFVNGRWVQDVALTTALIQAYHTLLMVGRYPLAILFLTLPPEDVDVNVHPAKAQVRFRSPDRLFSLVQRGARRALLAYSPVPQIAPTLWGGRGQSSPALVSPSGAGSAGLDWQILGDRTGAEYKEPLASGLPAEGQRAPTAASQAGIPNLPLLRLVGQIGATYLVAEGPDGLYLIDQHAAHERVLFEKLLRQRDRGTISSQTLLTPQVVQLPPAQASLLQPQLDLLGSFGFEVVPFGPNAFQVRSMPALFGAADPGAALRALVEDFEEDETPLQAEIEAKIAGRVCKRLAVRAGMVLSPDEQRALLTDLESCESPRTCPHGRPTMIHLSVDLLERQFGRRGAR